MSVEKIRKQGGLAISRRRGNEREPPSHMIIQPLDQMRARQVPGTGWRRKFSVQQGSGFHAPGIISANLLQTFCKFGMIGYVYIRPTKEENL